MNAEQIEQVVKELTGPIFPVGATHLDDRYFKNLKTSCELVLSLVEHIKDVVVLNRGAYEASRIRARSYALSVLTRIHDACDLEMKSSAERSEEQA